MNDEMSEWSPLVGIFVIGTMVYGFTSLFMEIDQTEIWCSYVAFVIFITSPIWGVLLVLGIMMGTDWIGRMTISLFKRKKK